MNTYTWEDFHDFRVYFNIGPCFVPSAKSVEQAFHGTLTGLYGAVRDTRTNQRKSLFIQLLFKEPLDRMPLLINDTNRSIPGETLTIGKVARWRLRRGK